MDLVRSLDAFATDHRSRFPKARAVVGYSTQAVTKACKWLRERHPHLKVKRVKEEGVPFVRLSLKDKGAP